MQKKICLLVKSYGDFVIALNYLPKDNLIIVVHSSLKLLVAAMRTRHSFVFFGKSEQVFPIFDLKKSIFSIFRFKELFDLRNVLRKIISLSENNIVFLPEQRLFKLFLFDFKLKYYKKRQRGENIYDWWSDALKLKVPEMKELLIKKKQITIFPSSRLSKKEISKKNLSTIVSILKDLNIEFKICYFGSEYKSFTELKKIILSSSLVLSSDSLPAHLSYYYSIKHLIIYNSDVNQEFITPYAKKNKFWIDNLCSKKSDKIKLKLLSFISKV